MDSTVQYKLLVTPINIIKLSIKIIGKFNN